MLWPLGLSYDMNKLVKITVPWKPLNSSRKNDGFTLLEILVAMIIVAIGMFAIVSLILMVIKGNIHSERVTEATTIAQNRIEEIFDTDYNNVTTSVFGTYTPSPGDPPHPDHPNHALRMTVEDDVPDVNAKTITLDVYWNPATTTSSHKVSLKTIFAPLAP